MSAIRTGDDKRSEYSRRLMDQAVSRLADINARLASLNWEDYDDNDLFVEVSRVFCSYFKVGIRIPVGECTGNFGNRAEEILHFSGIRYKTAELPKGWWKTGGGGPLLGFLEDGTPVALLPGRIYGYRMYDPTQNTFTKVSASMAQRIQPTATALFRGISGSGKAGFRDIAELILRQNIYRDIAVILLCSLAANIISVIPSLVSDEIFDVVIPGTLRAVLFSFVLILAAFELAGVGFSIMMNLGVARIKTKAGIAVQAALWDRLLSLSVPFFRGYTTGELLQRVKSAETAKNLVSMDSLQKIFANVFSFVSVIVLFSLNAAITPYVLLMFLGLFAVYGFFWHKKYRLFTLLAAAENKAASFSRQAVRGVHRVKVSGAEERVFNIWSALEAEKRNAANRIKVADNALSAFMMFFDIASAAVVYLLIAGAGDVEMGMFVGYVSAFLVFKKSMTRLLKALGVLPELLAACANVKPLLEAETEYGAGKAVPRDMDGSIEVSHATFRYGESGRDVLSDISFRVEEGESVGVVGLSGGGKSTLIKLLLGFYRLESGKIYYGGYDLAAIDLRYLRGQIGVAMQGGALVAGDIYGNVTGDDPALTEADALDAIEKAGLTERVASLPDGIYARLEHCPLSDGEKQKLLLAQAIARKNKFIFLDEATSSLDAASQTKALESLKDVRATKVIIAQRLEAVRHCDRIIVIERGKIAAVDTYEEIVKSSALFK